MIDDVQRPVAILLDELRGANLDRLACSVSVGERFGRAVLSWAYGGSVRDLVVPAALAFAVALMPGLAAADAQPGTDFEVIVLRGASVVRVSGDASGAVREEILRADPRPARREPPAPAPAADADRPIVVVVEAAPGYAPGYGLLAPFYAGWGCAPHSQRPAHRVYRPGSGPPAFYHATLRRPGPI
jgi:hypothetical protein